MDLKKLHFVRRFLEQCQERKDHEALRYQSDNQWISISWKELHIQVFNIARALISNNIKEESKVGFFAANMPQWTMADIATSLVRAISVPIYATNTADQAAYIINNADIEIIFVGDTEQYEKILQVQPQCPSLRKIVLLKENVSSEGNLSVHLKDFIIETPNEALDTEIQQRIDRCQLLDIYTIIYTSGTTGTPKGVLIDFENIAYQLLNHDEVLSVSAGKKSLSFLPLSHIFERIWVLYVLHKGVVNYYLEDTSKIADTLKEVKPHYMCVVPRLLEKIYTKIYENITKANIFKRLVFSFSTRSGKQMLKAQQKEKNPSWFLQKCYNLANKLVFSKLRTLMGGNLEMMPCGGAALDPSIGRFFRVIGVPVIVGYGMTESTATISLWDNIPKKLKSVGKVVPHLEIKIGEDDEILVKGGSITKGYYKNPEETEKSFTKDGFLKTGDVGKIDKYGNIFITERIKELMKTSNGKYIAPQQIEGKIGKDSFIEQLAVIADMRNYVSALIVPNFEALVNYAKEINLSYKNYNDLIRKPQIVSMFEKRLQRLQKELPNYEQIKKFTLLVNPFSIESEELTPTLKLRRKNIYKNYRKEIDAMYA